MSNNTHDLPSAYDVLAQLTGTQQADESTLLLKTIRLDGGTQPRAEIDTALVDEYANAMEEGAAFPPVVVYYDGIDYWLADGFHRVAAVRRRGKDRILAQVKQGDQRAAVLYSVGANAEHGQRRTNEDKRRAVQRLLDDPEWGGWSNRDIARRCHVSEFLVRSMREPAPPLSAIKSQIMDTEPPAPTRTVRRGASTYQQKVSSEKRQEAAARKRITYVPIDDEGETHRDNSGQFHIAKLSDPQDVDMFANWLKEVMSQDAVGRFVVQVYRVLS